jgi:hypothetical protein
MHATLYRDWIVANAWTESVGLGSMFVIGSVIAPGLDRSTDAIVVIVAAFAAVALGAVLEGFVVGYAQEGILRDYLPNLRRWTWVIATVQGAALAWALGMLPSTAMTLTGGAAEPSPPEPGALVQYVLAAALGAVAGPILAAMQWTVLRNHVANGSRWLLASAVAWGGNQLVIFLGFYVVCGAAGAVVGAIHGRWMVQLIEEANLQGSPSRTCTPPHAPSADASASTAHPLCTFATAR